MLVTILKTILALGLIPIVLTMYLNKVKEVEGKWHERGITKSWLRLVLLFFVLAGGVVLEALDWRSESANRENDEPLELFTTSDYRNELDQYTPSNAVTNWDRQKAELLRKFEHAEYAMNNKDYAEGIKALSELVFGTDKAGELFVVKSFVVYHNLGCAYFMRQRNEGFEASRHLLTASDIVGNREIYREAIRESLTKVDEMTNQLD